MGNDCGGSGTEGAADARRAFLRKAVIVGTGAFAAPMIITIDPADAQALTSPPPQPPGSAEPQSPGHGRVGPPGTKGIRSAAQPSASGRTQLPRTGADIDRMVATGLAATAGGAALVLWSAEMKSKSPAPADREPEACEPEA